MGRHEGLLARFTKEVNGADLTKAQRVAIGAIGRRKGQPFVGSEMFPKTSQRGTRIKK